MTVSPMTTPAWPNGWFTVHFGVDDHHVDAVLADVEHQFGVKPHYSALLTTDEHIIVMGDSWDEWGNDENRPYESPAHVQITTPYLARAIEIESWLVRTYGTKGERWLHLWDEATFTVITVAGSSSQDFTTLQAVADDLRTTAASR